MFCPGRLLSWVGDRARGWFVVLWPRQNRGSNWPLVGGIVFGKGLLASAKAGVIGRRYAGRPERAGSLLVLRRLCSRCVVGIGRWNTPFSLFGCYAFMTVIIVMVL